MRLNSNTPRTLTVCAFTLVEILAAITILAVVLVLLSTILDAISRTWRDGEKRIENFQSGRAIMELISRELSSAVISSNHQLIENPFTTAQLITFQVARNADSIFWQAPLRDSVNGDVCEIGYYLADAGGQGTGPYQLKRFFVPSTHSKFLIYAKPPTSTAASWLATDTTTQFSTTEFSSVSSTVSDGILGFWIRCIDLNGEAIPWFKTNSPEATSSTNVTFNSAARFQTAIPGTPGPGTAPWPYTSNKGPVTVQANRLPSAIEISIVTIDSTTLRRNPVLPLTPSVASPSDVPPTVATFISATLPNNRIQSARLFTSRVSLSNGTQ